MHAHKLASRAAISRVLTTLAVVSIATVVSIAQGPKAAPAHEQLVFREDEPFDHAVSLPPEVLRALLETKEVKDSLRTAKRQPGNPSQLFRAAEVHLGGLDEVDLVIEGISSLTSGADNSWFWIALSAHNAPRVPVWCGGNLLEVMAKRTKGYRNIVCSWSAAALSRTSEYHFDGEKYVLWKETSKRAGQPGQVP
jgi:hypothetical protein